MGPFGWIQVIWGLVTLPFWLLLDFLMTIYNTISALLGIKLFTLTEKDQNLVQRITGHGGNSSEFIAAEAGPSWIAAIIDVVRVWMISPLMAPMKYLSTALGLGEIIADIQALVGWVCAGFQTHVRKIFFRLNKISWVGFLLSLGSLGAGGLVMGWIPNPRA
jgi:hypothetical protein